MSTLEYALINKHECKPEEVNSVIKKLSLEDRTQIMHDYSRRLQNGPMITCVAGILGDVRQEMDEEKLKQD